MTKPKRTLKSPCVSYDGPKDTKKVDLVSPGEEPKHMYIAVNLRCREEERKLIQLLLEFRDVFSWSYKDLKGLDPTVC